MMPAIACTNDIVLIIAIAGAAGPIAIAIAAKTFAVTIRVPIPNPIPRSSILNVKPCFFHSPIANPE